MSHFSGFPFATSVIAYAPGAQFEYTEERDPNVGFLFWPF